MTTRQAIVIGALIVIGVSQSGCASLGRKWKALVGGNPSSVADTERSEAAMTKFSSSGDVTPRVRRQYKRTTKQTLAEEAALEPSAGSLWVMEGQGAYLFSQNIVRMIGDPIGIVIEGEPREQLQNKADVIRSLLTKFEERQARLRSPAAEGGASAKDEKSGAKAEAEKNTKMASAAAGSETSAGKPDGASDINIKTVPTRITERTADGNYRVKGMQPFMIGSREYKVIVTGVVRAEDFDESGISATKLIDPKFDIVSNRRKEEM